MDAYFPKTRRPIGLNSSLKRPPPSVTPPTAAKIPNTPRTPENARLNRPSKPPPVKKKLQARSRTQDEQPQQLQQQTKQKSKTTSFQELFKSIHPPETRGDIPTPTKPTTKPLATPLTFETAQPTTVIRQPKPVSTGKISSGPLKGLSTGLLDLIRAKEAAAKATSPELERKKELLGIAPEIVRIVPTVFTANKKEIMFYDTVIEKCSKGLKSNYTSTTIIECIELMNEVAPEWISTVTISKGKFMRINRDKYTIPRLLDSIRKYKSKHHWT